MNTPYTTPRGRFDNSMGSKGNSRMPSRGSSHGVTPNGAGGAPRPLSGSERHAGSATSAYGRLGWYLGGIVVLHFMVQQINLTVFVGNALRGCSCIFGVAWVAFADRPPSNKGSSLPPPPVSNIPTHRDIRRGWCVLGAILGTFAVSEWLWNESWGYAALTRSVCLVAVFGSVLSLFRDHRRATKAKGRKRGSSSSAWHSISSHSSKMHESNLSSPEADMGCQKQQQSTMMELSPLSRHSGNGNKVASLGSSLPYGVTHSRCVGSAPVSYSSQASPSRYSTILGGDDAHYQNPMYSSSSSGGSPPATNVAHGGIGSSDRSSDASLVMQGSPIPATPSPQPHVVRGGLSGHLSGAAATASYFLSRIPWNSAPRRGSARRGNDTDENETRRMKRVDTDAGTEAMQALGFTNSTLPLYTENVRRWLANTVLHPLFDHMETVDKELSALGLRHLCCDHLPTSFNEKLSFAYDVSSAASPLTATAKAGAVFGATGFGKTTTGFGAKPAATGFGGGFGATKPAFGAKTAFGAGATLQQKPPTAAEQWGLPEVQPGSLKAALAAPGAMMPSTLTALHMMAPNDPIVQLRIRLEAFFRVKGFFSKEIQRKYVVERIRDLSHGAVMGAYCWVGGGSPPPSNSREGNGGSAFGTQGSHHPGSSVLRNKSGFLGENTSQASALSALTSGVLSGSMAGGVSSRIQGNLSTFENTHNLPCDAKLTLHLLTCFFDNLMPTVPGSRGFRPFTLRNTLALPELARDAKRCGPRFYVVSENPPHIKVVPGSTAAEDLLPDTPSTVCWDIPPGRNNLFHSILVWLVAARASGNHIGAISLDSYATGHVSTIVDNIAKF